MDLLGECKGDSQATTCKLQQRFKSHKNGNHLNPNWYATATLFEESWFISPDKTRMITIQRIRRQDVWSFFCIEIERGSSCRRASCGATMIESLRDAERCRRRGLCLFKTLSLLQRRSIFYWLSKTEQEDSQVWELQATWERGRLNPITNSDYMTNQTEHHWKTKTCEHSLMINMREQSYLTYFVYLRPISAEVWGSIYVVLWMIGLSALCGFKLVILRETAWL